MHLSYNSDGDLNTNGGSIVNSSQAEVQLSKFMFYAAVPRGEYKYDTSFGNTLNTILGKTKTVENLKLIQKYLERDLLHSEVFNDISTDVEVYSIARSKIAIKIIGDGLNASWSLSTSSGLGIDLKTFNDGTAVTELEPEVSSRVYVSVEGQMSYDITTIYQSCMTKNNITNINEADFYVRVLFKAANTSEARILRTEEYTIVSGLDSRKIEFYRSLSANGTLTVEVWPKTSEVTATSNPYLLRKNRTSSPTRLSNTY